MDDILHIRRKQRRGRNGTIHYSNRVEFMINGVNLRERVRKFESPFAGKLAGAYKMEFKNLHPLSAEEEAPKRAL